MNITHEIFGQESSLKLKMLEAGRSASIGCRNYSVEKVHKSILAGLILGAVVELARLAPSHVSAAAREKSSQINHLWAKLAKHAFLPSQQQDVRIRWMRPRTPRRPSRRPSILRMGHRKHGH